VATEATATLAATPQAAPTPTAQTCPSVRVTRRGVNLRDAPGLDGIVLRKLRLGEVLAVLDCVGGTRDGYTWWWVVGEDGQAGWAANNWLEVAGDPAGEADGT
jgi:hypothetical protein